MIWTGAEGGLGDFSELLWGYVPVIFLCYVHLTVMCYQYQLINWRTRGML